VDSYTDGADAIQYEWFVSLIAYPQGNVIAAYAYLLGGEPPETKLANGTPGYGSSPATAAIGWLLADQMKLFTYDYLGPGLDQLAYALDGRLFYVNGDAQVYTLEMGENKWSEKIFEPTNGNYVAIAVSPDSQDLAVMNFETALILDAVTGEVKQELQGIPPHSGLVLRLAYSPDGNQLAGADRKKIILWDTVTGNVLQTLKPPSVDSNCQNVTYSPNGFWLVANCKPNIIVWDTSNWSIIATLNYPASSDWISFTSDSKNMYYTAHRSGDEYQVIYIDTATWQWDRSQAYPPYSLHALSPDGKLLALATGNPTTEEDQPIQLIELTSGESLTLPNFSLSPVYMIFTPDSQTLVILDQDGYVYFYDLTRLIDK